MNLFEKIYNQGNRREYTPEDKPETRMELLRLVLKDRFFGLIPLNLVLLALYLPAVVWGVTGFFYILQALGPDGTFADFISLSRTWVLILIPCIAITGPVSCAMSILMRNLARDNARMKKAASMDALKGNWKQALLLSGITALMPALVWAAASYYVPLLGRYASVPLLLTGLVFAIWMLALPTLYMMIGTYELRLIEQIKNALALTLSKLPLVAGLRLLCMLPGMLMLLCLFIGSKLLSILLFIGCVYYIFFGFGLAKLLYAFMANKLCEENLNTMIDGAGTRIGMR